MKRLTAALLIIITLFFLITTPLVHVEAGGGIAKGILDGVLLSVLINGALLLLVAKHNQ